MKRILIHVLFWLAAASGAAAQGGVALGEALDRMRAGAWSDAAEIASRDGTVAQDVIEWHRLRAGQGTLPEVQEFLDRNTDWPGLDWLIRRSARAAIDAAPDERRAFFAEHPPRTPEATLAYARDLIALGERAEGEALVIRGWTTLSMSEGVENLYLREFGDLLEPHDFARLDHLLWERELNDAARMIDRVSDGQAALARARIALINQTAGVDALIEAVPEDLKADPGLAHERFVWRDRKGLDESARNLLLEVSVSAERLGRPSEWAPRRRNMARFEMRTGDARTAYRVASSHFLTEGSAYADLEWLSGFISLRLLDDPVTAIGHFRNFDAAVASPISKGRAGYWLGRAHEAAGNAAAAAEAYAMGARYQTSFYGLLAAERGGLPFDTSLAGTRTPDWRAMPFVESSVFKAGLLLLGAQEPVLAERFFTHLTESLPEDQANGLGAALLEMERHHIAVMVGKRAAQRGLTLPAPYYALHPVIELDLPMAPEMVLAIARRESEFDPGVVSGAGARGLMQVMPGTARDVARDIGRAALHSTGRLTADPEYNALLGATYLSQMAGLFDGNVVMMSAAYNAGPRRPDRWMELYGDPRRGDRDVIDWIEFIPFTETRNYVMRVTESLPVYRARLGQEPLPIPFTQELVGSTLRQYAPASD